MDFSFLSSRQLLQSGGGQGCLNLWERQRRRVSDAFSFSLVLCFWRWPEMSGSRWTKVDKSLNNWFVYLYLASCIVGRGGARLC